MVRLREDLVVKVADVSFEPEEPVVVAVRENMLTLSPEPQGGELNRLSGEIETIHFLGEWKRYTVRLANRDVVAVRVPSSSAMDSLTERDWVSVSFNPVHTQVYEYPAQGLKRELEVY
jgi:ABC-type Fe3+/spermidine/putrescine transport system ATPase subunit